MLRLRGTTLRDRTLSRLFLIPALFSLLFLPLRAGAAVSADEAAKMLPDQLADFQGQGQASLPQNILSQYPAEEYGVLSAAARQYVSTKGEKFRVYLIRTRSDSAAYALWTSVRRTQAGFPDSIRPGEVGTASALSDRALTFFRGMSFVQIEQTAERTHASPQALKELARNLAESMDKGEGEIPVLVKHLPGWEQSQGQAVYAVSLAALQKAIPNQPALDAVSFEGGGEAVTSTYGRARLTIIEYTTPQIAADSDARIQERIRQLQSAGQPAPTAYRRVGNYSVFVFDAPDETTATQLIDQVRYEQVVQWLGDNPRILERAQKEYMNTMGGTILAVLKASGLSLIVCFGIGGLVGALVFMRRRAQAAAVEAYSDAGGMLRLNIDEITAQTDSARLLGRGER